VSIALGIPPTLDICYKGSDFVKKVEQAVISNCLQLQFTLNKSKTWQAKQRARKSSQNKLQFLKFCQNSGAKQSKTRIDAKQTRTEGKVIFY
jgi:hypothetical protein